MRKLLFSCILGMASMAAQAAMVPYLKDGEFTASVQYQGYPVYSESHSYFGPRGAAIRGLAEDVYGIRAKIKKGIDDGLRKELDKAGASFYPGSLRGKIHAAISGVSGGFNKITVRGLSYGAVIEATERRYGLSVTCRASIALNNVGISAQYDPMTGKVVPGATMVDLGLRGTVTECTTSPSWMPLLGNLTEWLARRKAEGLLEDKMAAIPELVVQKVVGGLNDRLGAVYGLFGEESRVGGWPGGLMIRSYLRNNAPYLFSGREMSLYLGEEPVELVRYSGWSDDGVKEDDVFKLDISDGNHRFVLSLHDRRTFGFSFLCDLKSPSRNCHVDY